MSILDEELSSFQWIQLKLLSLDKYWPALVDNTSMSAIGLIFASVITVIVTWMLTRDNDASRFQPNTAFRRNATNRNVTYQHDTSTSLKSRNQKGKLILKWQMNLQISKIHCNTNYCFVYLELFIFSGAVTNDTKRNVSAFDASNNLNQKETSRLNQVIEIGTFSSCSYTRKSYNSWQ